jgi:hypothetical protein
MSSDAALLAQLGAAATPCDVAYVMVKFMEGEVKRWSYTVWGVGLAMGAALITAIGLIVAGKDAAAIVSGVATVASGAGVLRLVRQRGAAETRYEAAFNRLRQVCPAGT